MTSPSAATIAPVGSMIQKRLLSFWSGSGCSKAICLPSHICSANILSRSLRFVAGFSDRPVFHLMFFYAGADGSDEFFRFHYETVEWFLGNDCSSFLWDEWGSIVVLFLFESTPSKTAWKRGAAKWLCLADDRSHGIH